MRATVLLGSLLLLAALPLPAAGEDMLTLSLFCDDDGRTPFAMMEASFIDQGSASSQGCWMHVGMHTYFVGNDTLYTLHSGNGHLFSVEQQMSVPIEFVGVSTAPPIIHLDSSVPIETSIDGLNWQLIEEASYRYLGIPIPGFRQNVFFSFTTEPVEFRFLRVRQPLSALQGLAGYIDYSQIDLNVTVANPVEPVALTPQTGVAKACERDILEDLFALHPCTYGMLNHWDTPSWFHTYFLGDSRLDRIAGTVQFGYFRPDDPGGCCGQVVPGGMLNGELVVQTSVDGMAWDPVATLPVDYVLPEDFEVTGLAGKEAKFVRLASGPHPGYFLHPALKHPEAYLLSSELELDGLLPT